MGFLLSTLLPLRCAACGAPAPAGLCHSCGRRAVALQLPGQAFVMLEPDVAAIGWYAYTGVVAEAVRGMKLSGRWAAARPLGVQMRQRLGVPAWPLTWVPASRRKQRERGMDLPRLLAGCGAVGLLRRVSERPDQTELSAQERRRSPLGAFECTGGSPASVVVVDDVRTTGATARAAADALKSAGARRVLVVTFAVGGDEARGALPAPLSATRAPPPARRPASLDTGRW